MKEIKLDIIDDDFQLKGQVYSNNIKPWPVTFFEPGCMGWYTYIPTMECFHGILSMDHSLNGKLELIHGSRQFLSNSSIKITPELGYFYFFPHYLMHGVYPFNNTDEERRSISFNAKIDEEKFNVYG